MRLEPCKKVVILGNGKDKDNKNTLISKKSFNLLGHQWKEITYELKHGPMWKLGMGLAAFFATLGTFIVGLYISKNIQNLWRNAFTGKEVVVFKYEKMPPKVQNVAVVADNIMQPMQRDTINPQIANPIPKFNLPEKKNEVELQIAPDVQPKVKKDEGEFPQDPFIQPKVKIDDVEFQKKPDIKPEIEVKAVELQQNPVIQPKVEEKAVALQEALDIIVEGETPSHMYKRCFENPIGQKFLKAFNIYAKENKIGLLNLFPSLQESKIDYDRIKDEQFQAGFMMIDWCLRNHRFHDLFHAIEQIHEAEPIKRMIIESPLLNRIFNLEYNAEEAKPYNVNFPAGCFTTDPNSIFYNLENVYYCKPKSEPVAYQELDKLENIKTLVSLNSVFSKYSWFFIITLNIPAEFLINFISGEGSDIQSFYVIFDWARKTRKLHELYKSMEILEPDVSEQFKRDNPSLAEIFSNEPVGDLLRGYHIVYLKNDMWGQFRNKQELRFLQLLNNHSVLLSNLLKIVGVYMVNGQKLSKAQMIYNVMRNNLPKLFEIAKNLPNSEEIIAELINRP